MVCSVADVPVDLMSGWSWEKVFATPPSIRRRKFVSSSYDWLKTAGASARLVIGAHCAVPVSPHARASQWAGPHRTLGARPAESLMKHGDARYHRKILAALRWVLAFDNGNSREHSEL